MTWMKWTEEERNLLKEKYPKQGSGIPELLERHTKVAIYNQARLLDLNVESDAISRTQSSIQEKKNKEKLNLSPSKNLAYVLGVCLGDGWVNKPSRQDNRIGLESTDKEFIVSFRNSLREVGLNPYGIGSRKRKDRSRTWFVNTSNKWFCQWFHKLSYKDLRKLLEKNHFKKEFVRGFYESEGTFDRNGSRWRLRIYNTDSDLLSFVGELIKELGYETRITEEKTSYIDQIFDLRVTRGTNIVKFLREINPCISRKSLTSVNLSDRRGLKYPERGKQWSKDEEEFLIENYPQKSSFELSETLEKSATAIRQKANRMGVSVGRGANQYKR